MVDGIRFQIFISSTLKDLIPERSAVQDAVLMLGYV
jgi:hypothetical protein